MSTNRTIVRNASIVSAATLLSRGLGLVRDLIMAYTLGASVLADAFFVAFRVPNLLRSLFAEGSLTMAFVPTFVRIRQEQGDRAAFILARSIQIWLVLILGVLTLGVLLFPKAVTLMIASGFAAEKPEMFELTAGLVQICFPYILLISGVALCMGILNSMGHFLVPALAPCLLNITLIAASLGAIWMGGNVAVWLAWGVLVAGVGQWLLQQPVLRAKGFAWRGPVELAGPGVRRIGALMLPTILGSAVYQFNILIGTGMASFLPEGSISNLYYADRLFQFPLGVFGVAVGVATLPSLSSLAAPERRDEFRATLASSLGLTLFVNLPAAAGLAGLALPLVELLFGRGEFSAQAVHGTAMALLGYVVGLPAFSSVRSLASAYYALGDTKTPVRVALVCLGVYVAVGYAGMQVLGHVGLALASSVSAWINVLLLGFLLRRHLGAWFRPNRDHVLSVLLSLGLLAGCWASAGLGRISLLLIPLWVALYMGLALVLKVSQARLFADVLGRRFARKRA
ncbi:MAG: murein biosynthesis integral membrane protein MurJ [Deltaproteobacteria bacterium]|nr:murein biosynthesis integral membrane protein MurJ [Deltaproteobacteria bacterium]